MKRHRKVFDPKNENPFEISRSKVENFIRCPACFWLDKVKGVKFPSIPPFNINSNTDKLLKRDFDSVRGIKTHPILEKNGQRDPLLHRSKQHPAASLLHNSQHTTWPAFDAQSNNLEE